MSKNDKRPATNAKAKSVKTDVKTEKIKIPLSEKIEKPVELKNGVALIQKKEETFPLRDKTKYVFENKTLGKGKLVLAIVQSYVVKHPKVTIVELQKVFPKELQKHYGVIVPLNEAKKKCEHYQRYFIGEGQAIKLADGSSVSVTTQWGSENIKPFVETAIKLGFIITEVK